MPTHSLIKLVPPIHLTKSTNFSSNILINNFNKLDIKSASKTICDLVHSNPQRKIVSDAGIYCIPCKNYKSKYIGETSTNLHGRLKEHKRDIRIVT